MSTFLATTTVDVFRGDVQNALDDPVPEVDQPMVDDLPMAITEHDRKVFFPESGEIRTVRYLTGRATYGSDVQKGDRLRDTRTGRVYSVEVVTGGNRTITGFSELMCDLRQL